MASAALPKCLIPNPTMFTFLLIAGIFATVASAYDGTVCCRNAARLPELRLELGEYPWEVCSLNQTDQYPEGKKFPSVKISMGWCKENCPGFQYSTLAQWLQPLATWIAPYIGLLLLCPIGTTSSQRESKSVQGIWKVLDWIMERAMDFAEYVSLLGDPGSAICGVFSEIDSDLKMLRKHQRLPLRIDPQNDLKVNRTILQVLIMVGDTDFNDEDKHLDDFKRRIYMGIVNPATPTVSGETGRPNVLLSRHPSYIKMAIRTLVEARLSFFNAVFLPVVLMLAVTASVFYDAYTKLGDNDTAHGLAFGVWYSWLIVLSVAGNCFASSMNPGLTRTVLKPLINLSERRMPLRKSFVNSKLWEKWGDGVHPKKDLEKPHHTPELCMRDWMKFSAGQFLGWACVAFPTACAAVISYTTPTVGLGCRSFTYLLYGVFAFATAFLNVGCQWADQRLDWSVCRSKDKLGKPVMSAVTGAYWFLTSVNAMVIFVGTVLHLAGVYRSCRCKRLFVSDDYLVELNSNTQLAIDNADAFWVPFGYVAFGIIWLICVIVIAIRKYITVRMDEWMEELEDRLELDGVPSTSPKKTDEPTVEIAEMR